MSNQQKIKFSFPFNDLGGLSLRNTVGVPLPRFGPYSTPVCVKELPMCLPNLKVIAWFLRPDKDLPQIFPTDGQMNEHAKIDSEFTIDQEYLYTLRDIRNHLLRDANVSTNRI